MIEQFPELSSDLRQGSVFLLQENQMVKAVAAARKAARKAIESTYEGVCTIVERRDMRDEVTKITRKSEVTVIENQPCK